MIDLDHFKRLNDTYGHGAGDQALTAVGWRCAKRVPIPRSSAGPAGEECLIIDNLPLRTAQAFPSRLCAAIDELPQPVTASVGAAVMPRSRIGDPDAAIQQLVRTADAAMYQAKRSGGNQVFSEVDE